MKTALITGASRGLGKAITQMLLENNYQVIATSTSGEGDIEHKNITWFKLSADKSEEIINLVEQVKKQYESLDLLFNNAGIFIDRDNAGINLDSLQQTLEVNLFGPIDLAQQLMDIMPEGSLVINMSSGLGSLTNDMGPGYGAYRISKAALNMFTRVLSSRLQAKGIKVISLDPGWVKTDMGGSAAPRNPEDVANDVKNLLANYENLQTGMFYFEGEVREW